MSIEVRIPKEIKEYKEKIIFGLSFRQLVCVFIGGIICLITYFLTKQFIGSNLASDIVIIEAMPIFAFGFIKVRGLNFEEYALIFIKHKLKQNKRIYENKLKIEYIEKEKIESSKEVKKVEFNKFRVEAEEQRAIGRTKKIKEIRRRIKNAKKEFKAETKRRQTKEIDESKEQIKVARENYKRARKGKNK